jgi:ABA responsive element binding factor
VWKGISVARGLSWPAVPLGLPDGDMVVGADARRVRKPAHMDPTDRVVVQRQKCMIKNRESAARSRDRKQVR